VTCDEAHNRYRWSHRRLASTGSERPRETGARLAITAEAMAARLADLDRAQPAVELVVLFGSGAKGQTRAGSDLDIAVHSDGPTDLDAVYLILTPRSAPIAWIWSTSAGRDRCSPSRWHARGRLLFERAPGVLRSFQALACRRYGDTAKLRRAQQRAIRVFLDRHGLAWVRSPRKAAERLLPEVIDAASHISAHLLPSSA
jgi:uncharacterized protein